MKALIVSGGSKPDKKLIMDLSEKCDLIIGADKGCDSFFECGITPKFIVGDFDSAEKKSIDYLSESGAIKIKYNEEKDFTDSFSALNLAIDEGADEVLLLGVTGTRLDHTFGNIGLLLTALSKGVKAVIIDENNKIELLKSGCEFKRDERYRYISFLAYGGEVKNLNIYNAKYKLENYNLMIGDTRTVSNEFIDEYINIEFEEGLLLAVYSKD